MLVLRVADEVVQVLPKARVIGHLQVLQRARCGDMKRLTGLNVFPVDSFEELVFLDLIHSLCSEPLNIVATEQLVDEVLSLW